MFLARVSHFSRIVVSEHFFEYDYLMNKIINIKSKKAIKEINAFKEKRYSLVDIKFENVHLRDINKLLSDELFDKNDLYINSVTLWELMQPIGSAGTHNYHNLTPNDIFEAINSISKPACVLKVKRDRYAIIPVTISSFNEPLMVVIEIGGELINKQNANINKIVTIYPKSDIDAYLLKVNPKNILFKKK